jgi:cell division ATPase FtsA
VPHLADIPTDRIVFTGGGAKLDGFLNIAKYIFQRKVRLATPRGLDGMPEGTNDPAYSAAAGIALWGTRNLPAENHVTERKSTTTSDDSGEVTTTPSSALSRFRGWLPKREKETAGT